MNKPKDPSHAQIVNHNNNIIKQFKTYKENNEKEMLQLVNKLNALSEVKEKNCNLESNVNQLKDTNASLEEKNCELESNVNQLKDTNASLEEIKKNFDFKNIFISELKDMLTKKDLELFELNQKNTSLQEIIDNYKQKTYHKTIIFNSPNEK